MTNTLPNLETRLTALESDLAHQKQDNADLRQRVADLEAFKSMALREKQRMTEFAAWREQRLNTSAARQHLTSKTLSASSKDQV